MTTATGQGAAAVIETHSGVVFFVGDRAYKLKKPVDLAFLDYRERGALLPACRREVVLNRRLAPDVYLGIADVTGPDREPCDHLVVMRRMPEDRRLSALVAAEVPVDGHLIRLAELLARFHERADRSPAIVEAGRGDAELVRWEVNAREMAVRWRPVRPRGAGRRPGPGPSLPRRPRPAVRRPHPRRRDLRRPRRPPGRRHLLPDDGPRVLDCLEFDDRLRHGDGLADAAFLAMDLERLGWPDLARHFLDSYRMAAGDSWPAALVHHRIAYRAQVRAKVAALRRGRARGRPA